MLVRRSLITLAVVLFCVLRSAATPPAVATNAVGSPSPRFYAYCVEMGVAGVKQRPVIEQIKLLKQLGFDGGAFLMWLDEKTITQNLQAVDEAGLALPMLEVDINVGPRGPAYDPR